LFDVDKSFHNFENFLKKRSSWRSQGFKTKEEPDKNRKERYELLKNLPFQALNGSQELLQQQKKSRGKERGEAKKHERGGVRRSFSQSEAGVFPDHWTINLERGGQRVS
jgi:hypothetical protein